MEKKKCRVYLNRLIDYWELRCFCCCSITKSYPILLATPIVACQASLSMEFSRQAYWSRLPFPIPGDLPNPDIGPVSLAPQVNPLSLSHLGSPIGTYPPDDFNNPLWIPPAHSHFRLDFCLFLLSQGSHSLTLWSECQTLCKTDRGMARWRTVRSLPSRSFLFGWGFEEGQTY